jgi:membrane fusion protein (multidrug efflux system)
VIRAAAPERIAARVREGLRVDAVLDAYPDVRLEGRIARVYAYLDERTRTRTFEVAVPADVELLPGMFARLRLPLATVDDAVVVPRDAVLVDQDGQSVVFVVNDGHGQQRVVRVGIEEGSRVQVLAGLAPGDTVVVAGQEGLRDGAPLRVIESSSPDGPQNGPGARRDRNRQEKSPQ